MSKLWNEADEVPLNSMKTLTRTHKALDLHSPQRKEHRGLRTADSALALIFGKGLQRPIGRRRLAGGKLKICTTVEAQMTSLRCSWNHSMPHTFYDIYI